MKIAKVAGTRQIRPIDREIAKLQLRLTELLALREALKRKQSDIDARENVLTLRAMQSIAKGAKISAIAKGYGLSAPCLYGRIKKEWERSFPHHYQESLSAINRLGIVKAIRISCPEFTH